MEYKEELRALQLTIEELQCANRKLRDELAITLNDRYVYQAKAMRVKTEFVAETTGPKDSQMDEMRQLKRQLADYKNELDTIKGSNTYKLWKVYNRMPKPLRAIMHAAMVMAKKVYQTIKKVFS